MSAEIRKARQELARAERERERLRVRHKRERAKADDAVRAKARALRKLTGEPARRKRTPAVQAGPKALALVFGSLRRGALSQARITHVTGLNDGTVSYALRALVAEGAVVPTGRRVDGSREFRVSARAARRAA